MHAQGTGSATSGGAASGRAPAAWTSWADVAGLMLQSGGSASALHSLAKDRDDAAARQAGRPEGTEKAS